MTGEAGSDDPGIDDDERTARLQALLSVRVAARQDELGPGPLRGRRRGAGPSPDDRDDEDRDGRPRPVRSLRPGTVLAVLVLLGLFATGAGLVYAGTRILRSSTQGEVVARQTDPAAPGYEAVVSSTPTLLIVHDVDETVASLTVLTLPDPNAGGGGVILVPTRTVATVPGWGEAPIEVAYDLGDDQNMRGVVEDLLTVGIGDVVVVDDDRWAGLVGPVAPLTVDNPVELEVDGELRFPAGEIELSAEDVGPYLAAHVEGESDLARLFRHEGFWSSWLAAVGEDGRPGAVPGELESGIGRFVRSLAAGPTVVEPWPADAVTVDGLDDEARYLSRPDEVAALIAELVPLPRSPGPGVRPRVRVLNGTDDLDEARSVALELPPVGVEVVAVGNAAAFDEETTTIAYVHAGHEAVARGIRDLLGVGEVLVDPRPSDVVDITVTLGADHD